MGTNTQNSVETLVADHKYRGQYVAFRSFADRTVVAYGKEMKKVMQKARKKAPDPVLFFVPLQNEIHIY